MSMQASLWLWASTDTSPSLPRSTYMTTSPRYTHLHTETCTLAFTHKFNVFLTLQTHKGRRIVGLEDTYYLNAQFTVDSDSNYCFLLRYKHTHNIHLNTVYTNVGTPICSHLTCTHTHTYTNIFVSK